MISDKESGRVFQKILLKGGLQGVRLNDFVVLLRLMALRRTNGRFDSA